VIATADAAGMWEWSGRMQTMLTVCGPLLKQTIAGGCCWLLAVLLLLLLLLLCDCLAVAMLFVLAVGSRIVFKKPIALLTAVFLKGNVP